MFELVKRFALRIAKVPPEPHAPAGSPGSIKIFRAADNYWKYLLVTWGLRQVAGVFGIVFFLSMTSTWLAAGAGAATDETRGNTREGHRLVELRVVPFVPKALHTLELLGLGLLLVQMPFTLAATRLNYELRWYIVTDRSLRLREGIFRVREMTLTFANVQNISIRQGPLQRLLGIADVVVRTAGGGSGGEQHGGDGQGRGASMHTGTLRAVDNAESVRDLILDRLRRFRDSGLGDPDDHRPQTPGVPAGSAALLRAAARELLEDARALR